MPGQIGKYAIPTGNVSCGFPEFLLSRERIVLEDRQIQLRQHHSMLRARLASARGTDLGAPAGVKPLTATIAPLGISTAASSAVRGYVLLVAIVSTSFEFRRTPLKKSSDTLLIIGAVINPAPYSLNPLEPFRVKRVRLAEDSQLLLQ